MDKVLFVLRIPPPYGGGEIVSQELFDKLKERYNFLLIRQSGLSKAKQANPNLYSVFRGIEFIIKAMVRIVSTQPTILFIGLSKGTGSFLRNSIVILFARLVGVKVYGELHGMNFPFLQMKYFRLYFRFVIKHIEKIRVLGESIKHYLVDQGVESRDICNPEWHNVTN